MHEMERALDVDLFLEAQGQWVKDSPHCLVILHEMFLHATSKGRKEAERVVCQGHQQHMPQLDPEVGIPAIQLVHLDTGREKLLDLYLEVYKLHRLPSSPPRELAILKEVSSALPCHSLEKEGTPDTQRQPNPKDFHPPQSTTSMGEGKFAGQKPHQGVQSASESFVNHCDPRRGNQEVTSDEGPFWYWMET